MTKRSFQRRYFCFTEESEVIGEERKTESKDGNVGWRNGKNRQKIKRNKARKESCLSLTFLI